MVDSKSGNLGHLVMPDSKEVQKKREMIASYHKVIGDILKGLPLDKSGMV